MIHALLAIVFLFPTTMQDKDKIDSKLIIGKWDAEVVPDGIDKITVEFTNDNKLHLHLERSGEKQKVSGTYKVDGNKLEVKLE
ncbi:MAG TPA: hypothetical protein PKA06_01005, partial [Gemmatales bacterium]|nr:hypothetical protein [Gemmatales bacterium]